MCQSLALSALKFDASLIHKSITRQGVLSHTDTPLKQKVWLGSFVRDRDTTQGTRGRHGKKRNQSDHKIQINAISSFLPRYHGIGEAGGGGHCGRNSLSYLWSVRTNTKNTSFSSQLQKRVMRANTWTEKLALMTFQLGTKSFSDCNWLFATVTKKSGIILTPRALSIIGY